MNLTFRKYLFLAENNKRRERVRARAKLSMPEGGGGTESWRRPVTINVSVEKTIKNYLNVCHLSSTVAQIENQTKSKLSKKLRMGYVRLCVVYGINELIKCLSTANCN